jgi:hypothetical protein
MPIQTSTQSTSMASRLQLRLGFLPLSTRWPPIGGPILARLPDESYAKRYFVTHAKPTNNATTQATAIPIHMTAAPRARFP